MRFDPDCRIHELVRTVPHLAFEVDDLEAGAGRPARHQPDELAVPRVRVAMIEDGGAPVELMEFSKK